MEVSGQVQTPAALLPEKISATYWLSEYLGVNPSDIPIRYNEEWRDQRHRGQPAEGRKLRIVY